MLTSICTSKVYKKCYSKRPMVWPSSSLSIRPSYRVRGEEILDGGGGRGRRERKA